MKQCKYSILCLFKIIKLLTRLIGVFKGCERVEIKEMNETIEETEFVYKPAMLYDARYFMLKRRKIKGAVKSKMAETK